MAGEEKKEKKPFVAVGVEKKPFVPVGTDEPVKKKEFMPLPSSGGESRSPESELVDSNAKEALDEFEQTGDVPDVGKEYKKGPKTDSPYQYQTDYKPQTSTTVTQVGATSEGTESAEQSATVLATQKQEKEKREAKGAEVREEVSKTYGNEQEQQRAAKNLEIQVDEAEKILEENKTELSEKFEGKNPPANTPEGRHKRALENKISETEDFIAKNTAEKTKIETVLSKEDEDLYPYSIGKEETYAKSFGKAIIEGASSITKQIGIAADALDNDDKKLQDYAFYKLGEDMASSAKENFGEVNPIHAEDFANKLASGGGSMLPMVVGGAAAKGLKISSAATTAFMGGAMNGVPAYEQAMEAITDAKEMDDNDYLNKYMHDDTTMEEVLAQKNENMAEDAEETALEANLLAFGVGTLEAIPLERAFGTFSKVAGAKGQASLYNALKSGTVGGIEEMTQEVFTEYMTDLTAKELYESTKELEVKLQEVGAPSFVLGALMGTGSVAVGRIMNNPESSEADIKKAKEIKAFLDDRAKSLPKDGMEMVSDPITNEEIDELEKKKIQLESTAGDKDVPEGAKDIVKEEIDIIQEAIDKDRATETDKRIEELSTKQEQVELTEKKKELEESIDKIDGPAKEAVQKKIDEIDSELAPQEDKRTTEELIKAEDDLYNEISNHYINKGLTEEQADHLVSFGEDIKNMPDFKEEAELFDDEIIDLHRELKKTEDERIKRETKLSDNTLEALTHAFKDSGFSGKALDIVEDFFKTKIKFGSFNDLKKKFDNNNFKDLKKDLTLKLFSELHPDKFKGIDTVDQIPNEFRLSIESKVDDVISKIKEQQTGTIDLAPKETEEQFVERALEEAAEDTGELSENETKVITGLAKKQYNNRKPREIEEYKESEPQPDVEPETPEGTKEGREKMLAPGKKYTTKDGKYTIDEKGDITHTKGKNKGKEASKPTKEGVRIERATEQSIVGETVESSIEEGMTETDINDIVAEKSNNPLEVSQTIDSQPKEPGYDAKQRAIAEAIGKGGVSRQQVEDAIGPENIHGQMGKAWLRVGGRTVDGDIVQALNQENTEGTPDFPFSGEITVEDVYAFLQEFPQGYDRFIAAGRYTPQERALRDKFESLTGMEYTERRGKIISDNVSNAKKGTQKVMPAEANKAKKKDKKMQEQASGVPAPKLTKAEQGQIDAQEEKSKAADELNSLADKLDKFADDMGEASKGMMLSTPGISPKMIQSAIKLVAKGLRGGATLAQAMKKAISSLRASLSKADQDTITDEQIEKSIMDGISEASKTSQEEKSTELAEKVDSSFDNNEAYRGNDFTQAEIDEAIQAVETGTASESSAPLIEALNDVFFGDKVAVMGALNDIKNGARLSEVISKEIARLKRSTNPDHLAETKKKEKESSPAIVVTPAPGVSVDIDNKSVLPLWLRTFAKKWFTQAGLFTKADFAAKTTRDGKIASQIKKGESIYSKLNTIVNKIHGKRSASATWLNVVPDSVLVEMNEYLNGERKIEDVSGMTPEFEEALNNARDHVSELSDLISKSPAVSGKLHPMFVNNNKPAVDSVLAANEVLDFIYKGDDGKTNIPAKVSDAINKILKGKKVDPKILPEKVFNAITELKKQMDAAGVTEKVTLRDVRQGKLPATIQSNIGTYLNRAYEIFDNKDWAKKVKKNPEVAKAFESWLRENLEKNGDVLSDSQINGIMAGILKATYTSPGTLFSDGGSSKMNFDSFKGRKNLPKEFRDFIGEYKNPYMNYLRTVEQQATLLAKQEFLAQMARNGKGEYLFDEELVIDGVEYIYQIPDSPEYGAMAGMYTDENTHAAFNDYFNSPETNAIIKLLLQANGVLKWGMTVGNPMTHSRNFISNFKFSIKNGHAVINPKGLGLRSDAWDAVKSGIFLAEGGLFSKNNEKALELYRLVQELGVTGHGVRSGVYRDSVDKPLRGDDPYGLVKQVYDNKTVEALRKRLGSGFDAAAKMYELEDDVHKINGFLAEKARLIKAYEGKGVDMDTINKEAAAIINESAYPNYDKVPMFVKALSVNPFVGSFPSFYYESWRIRFATLGRMSEELKSDNKEIVKTGRKRMAGIAAANAMFIAASAYTAKLAFGDDPEDEEDIKDSIKRILPDWDEGIMMNVLDWDREKGLLTYQNQSFSDPDAGVNAPFTAAWQHAKEGDMWPAVKTLFSKAIDPFVNRDILFSILSDIDRNEIRGTKKKIYNETDWKHNSLRAYGDILNHTFEKAQPGIVKAAITRFPRAFAGETSKLGQKYTVKAEVWRFAGVATQTIDIRVGYNFKVGAAGRNYNANKKEYSSLEWDENAKKEDYDEEYDLLNDRMESEYNELLKDVKGMKTLGMSKSEISKMLNNSNLGYYKNSLLKGYDYSKVKLPKKSEEHRKK